MLKCPDVTIPLILVGQKCEWGERRVNEEVVLGHIALALEKKVARFSAGLLKLEEKQWTEQ